MLDLPLKDNFLKDLFLSGQFQLLDGHIYTKNDVTKIRYDYLDSRRNKTQHPLDMSQVNERLVFDHFEDVLDVGD